MGAFCYKSTLPDHDLNNITKNGIYWCNKNWPDSKHYPSGCVTGFMLVCTNGASITQLFMPTGNQQPKYRNKESSSWTSW